jgi:hypothetical protein
MSISELSGSSRTNYIQATPETTLPHSADDNKPSLSLCERICNAYRNAIKAFVKFLQKHNWFVTSLILGTLLTEVWQALKAAFFMPANWKKHFNFYNLNPTTLSETQAQKPPVLLLHGNFHDQTAWLSFAKKLKESSLGPVYSVNFPSGKCTDKDYEILNKKVREIKAQYKQLGVDNIQINLVGHSRGGHLAYCYSWIRNEGEKAYWEKNKDIGKVIKIGSVLVQEDLDCIEKIDSTSKDRLYEIRGEYDILDDKKSVLPSDNQRTVATGHLGLLYSPEVHHQVIDWLK